MDTGQAAKETLETRKGRRIRRVKADLSGSARPAPQGTLSFLYDPKSPNKLLMCNGEGKKKKSESLQRLKEIQ